MNVKRLKTEVDFQTVSFEREEPLATYNRGTINRLPNEILSTIFSFLRDDQDIRSILQVSRRWNQVYLSPIRVRNNKTVLSFLEGMLASGQAKELIPNLTQLHKDYLTSLQKAVGMDQIEIANRNFAFNIRKILHQLSLLQVNCIFFNVIPLENKSTELSFIQKGKETYLKTNEFFTDEESREILNVSYNTLRGYIENFRRHPVEIQRSVFHKIISVHKMLTKAMPDMCIFQDFRYLYTCHDRLTLIRYMINDITGFDRAWLDSYKFEELFQEYPQEFHQWLPNGETLLGKPFIAFTIYPLCYRIVEAELSKDEIENSLLSPSETVISLERLKNANEEILPFIYIQLSLQLLRVGRIQESLEWLSKLNNPFILESNYYNENCMLIYAKRLIEHRSWKAVGVLKLAENLSEDFFKLLLKYILCELKENGKNEADWKNVVDYIQSDSKIKNSLISQIKPIEIDLALVFPESLTHSAHYSDLIMSIIVEILPLREILGQVPYDQTFRVLKEEARQVLNKF